MDSKWDSSKRATSNIYMHKNKIGTLPDTIYKNKFEMY